MELINVQKEKTNVWDKEVAHLVRTCHGKQPTLFHLRIIPTNRCNQKCLYCIGGNRKINFSEELSDKKHIETINDAISLGLRHLKIIGGGEALVRRNLIINIMEILKRNPQVFCSLHSNGTLFDESMVKLCVESGLDWLSISVDGPKKANDLLRGKGTYDRILFTLEKFAHWKKKLRTDKPQIDFSTVLSSKNYDKLDELIMLAKEFNVGHLHIQPMYVVPNNKLSHLLKLTSSEAHDFQNLIPKYKLLVDKYNIHNNLEEISPNIIKKSESTPGKIMDEDLIKNKSNDSLACNLFNVFCLDFWNFLMISPNGDIQFCLKEYDFGFNAKKHKLKDVWHSTKLNEIRKNFLAGNKFEECNTCCPAKMLETLEIKAKMLKQIHNTKFY